jgi:outer membrane immunogenic protein
MKKLLVASVAVAALLGAPAFAADYPVKAAPAAAFNWSGFYIGGNGGYAWDGDTALNFLAVGVHTPFSPKGDLAGGQIGFNVQRGPWVLGAEITGDWSGVKAQNIAPVAVTVTTKLQDLETVTGRLGYAFNNVLFYGKAGGAWGSVKDSFAPGGVFLGATTNRRNGYVAGGGIEYGLTPNIILGVEYDYIRFSNQSGLLVTGITPFNSTDFTLQSVLGRVSYKF